MGIRELRVDGGPVALGGTVRGAGDAVLLLHGGPGLGVEYIEPLADELAEGYLVAVHQQRGLAPSGTHGPFTVADHVDDVRRVLDALGWARVTVVGHSWGGHLALHVASALDDRIDAVLAVEPLGAVGDGGAAEFEAELLGRLAPAERVRAAELDQRAMQGQGTPGDALESLRLMWPAYFADPSAAPEMPTVRVSVECYAETMESLDRELPSLERSLPGIDVPVGFVVGAGSPIPATAATDTAQRIPGSWVDSVPEAGHFVWVEAPGRVRAALERLREPHGS
jgi:pimeloyl-ACP methyl ester carboxylesterase